MSYELRPYQREAIDAVNSCLADPGVNPVISLPTGSGKTVVIAELAVQAVKQGLRVLILSHVKELLVQTYNHIQKMDSSVNLGLYSAGLDRRETVSQVLIAGIQSLDKKVEQIGRRDIVIIDEAHLVSNEDKSRYRRTVAKLRAMNPDVRFVGLTATPYRMRTGLITTGEKTLFNRIVYEKSVSALIDEGYLSPIMSRVVKKEVETQGLHIKKGEFVEKEVDELVNKEEMIVSACEEIIDKAREFDRKKVLIFTSNIKHAENVYEKIKEISGEDCELITGETKAENRDSILCRFRYGSLRYVVNVNVLTTGFDNPRIDLVAIIRPTASPGLYYQMAGRGLRKADGKQYCLLLDFGQNIKRHGPIDDLSVMPSKKRKIKLISCPKCGLIVKRTARKCPWCGTAIPHGISLSKPTTTLTWNSSDLDPLANRGREFFTERGLLTLRLLAKHMMNLFRAGKYDNCPLIEGKKNPDNVHHKGQYDLSLHFSYTFGSFGIKNYWDLTRFNDVYFKKDEFDRNIEFQEELFGYFGKVLDISLKGMTYPREQLIKEMIDCAWAWNVKERDDCRFVSLLVWWQVMSVRPSKMDYYHLAIVKVIESFLREEFVSREEMTEFYKKTFLNHFFKKDYFRFTGKVARKISGFAYEVKEAFEEYQREQVGQKQNIDLDSSVCKMTKEEKFKAMCGLYQLVCREQARSKKIRDEVERINLYKLVDRDLRKDVIFSKQFPSLIRSVVFEQLARWKKHE